MMRDRERQPRRKDMPTISARKNNTTASINEWHHLFFVLLFIPTNIGEKIGNKNKEGSESS
jgi:hypothetical protein